MTLVQLPRVVTSTATTSSPATAGAHTPVDAGAGAVTMTLPAAPTYPGDYLSIEKLDATTNPVTIAGNIRGASTSFTLAWQYETVTLHWTGSTWWPTEGRATELAINAAIDAKIAAYQAAEINAKGSLFGAVGDGVTDDTAALQAFFNYCINNGRSGFIPDGVYKITSTITGQRRPGWSIRGAHRGSVTIRQATDNIPVLDLGTGTASQMHTWKLTDVTLDYSNAQPATNTNANGIRFSGMGYQYVLENITFNRGYYGITIGAGVIPPWGGTMNNLVFSSGLTGGAMNWQPGSTAGVPNNVWGRIVVYGDVMVGPIFNRISGEAFTIASIEFLNVNQGAQLMVFAAGGSATIGALKVEVSTWLATTKLLQFLQSNWITIGELDFSGSTPTVNNVPSGSTLTFVSAEGSGPGQVKIGRLRLDNFSSKPGGGAAASYAISATAGANVTVDDLILGTDWQLTNFGASAAADFVTVTSQVNGHLQVKGDADYPVVQGDPAVSVFNTAFTAPRTITLPSDSRILFNGLRYRLVFAGAITGTNTAVIKAGATTLATLTVDGTVEYTYRRNAGSPAAGWTRTL
jgi:hypothetical protein